jgi:hypothetical protein
MESSLLKRVLLVGVGSAVAFNGVVVAVAPAQIPDTCGVAAEGPDLVVLLRHRAVLLAVVGLALAVSGFRRELRVLAVPAAGAGTGAYALLAAGAELNGHRGARRRPAGAGRRPARSEGRGRPRRCAVRAVRVGRDTGRRAQWDGAIRCPRGRSGSMAG